MGEPEWVSAYVVLYSRYVVACVVDLDDSGRNEGRWEKRTAYEGLTVELELGFDLSFGPLFGLRVGKGFDVNHLVEIVPGGQEADDGCSCHGDRWVRRK